MGLFKHAGIVICLGLGVILALPLEATAEEAPSLGVIEGVGAEARMQGPTLLSRQRIGESHCRNAIPFPIGQNKNTSFEANGTMGLDARVLFYFNATGVTPTMAMTRPGADSDYALAYLDADKKLFDGSKTYRLHLPPNVPVNIFWAVTLYDTQTGSLLQTDQTFPTVGSATSPIRKIDDSGPPARGDSKRGGERDQERGSESDCVSGNVARAAR